MNPFFSIIIPVYRVEKYIDECIHSILKQSYTNYQVILVDDGSPDRCPDICDHYAENYQNIITIHQKNSGPSVARNTGMKAAIGEYIIFLDSDDYWDNSDCLQKIYERIMISSPDVLLLGVYKFYTSTQKKEHARIPITIKGDWSEEDKIIYCMKTNSYVACPWDRVLKRSFLLEHELYFVEGMLSEDVEWSARVLLYRPKIDTIPEALYVYRQQNTSSITSNITRRNLKDIISIFDKYLEKSNVCDSEALMHFLAEQYVLWMATSGVVSWIDKKDLVKYMKKYWYLIDYNYYPHVRMISKLRFMGYYFSITLLGLYNRLRKV